jgi:hypothetical protein
LHWYAWQVPAGKLPLSIADWSARRDSGFGLKKPLYGGAFLFSLLL